MNAAFEPSDRTPGSFRARVIAILLFFAVLTGLVFAIGEILRQQESRFEHDGRLAAVLDNRAEGEMYRGYPPARELAPEETSARQRDLDAWYALRAYPGAPPRIPHAVEDEQRIGAGCLDCHENGGYVPKWNAYAPVTPHPDYLSCRQCHVPQRTEELFVATEWQQSPRPRIKRPALPGGPPPIPHAVQLRERCHACHVGPAAPKAIRMTHPERLNCRQCHVPRQTMDVFDRSTTAAGTP